MLALGLVCLPWVGLWLLLEAPTGFAQMGWGFALLWVFGLADGLALACFGALALGVGCVVSGCGVCGVGVWGVALAHAPLGRLSFLRFALQTPTMIKSTMKNPKALPRPR